MPTASQPPLAINLLEAHAYAHHPVMLAAEMGPFVFERSFLVEPNGLRVPANFDCNIDFERKGKGLAQKRPGAYSHWGQNNYFADVASRWTACYEHYSVMKSDLLMVRPSLPIVDDEYHEHVAVWHSVLRSNPTRPFVAMELGARWGTWGARAVMMLRAHRPQQPHALLLVESNKKHCKGATDVMTKNAIEHTLMCETISRGRHMVNWAARYDHVDLIDMGKSPELPCPAYILRTHECKS
jgi:hypothetical protein